MKNLVFLILFLQLGCASIDKAMTGASTMPSEAEREKIAISFPELSKEQKAKFIAGEPWVGMGQTQLKAMWNNEPKKTQKKLTTNGDAEIQLYEVRVGDWKTGIKSKYYKVTILNQKVVELQELDENVGSFDKL